MWFNKILNNSEPDDTKVPQEDVTPPEEDTWVWVEGYKGVDQDMQGYHGFQFKLNTTYIATGEVELCNNGFHFCLKLEDVINNFYGWLSCEGNRYFKVKALVKKKYVDSYGSHHKLVAKEIILTEEITYNQETIDTICKCHDIQIDSVDAFKEMCKLGYYQYRFNQCKDLLAQKYSPAFVAVFTDMLCEQTANHFGYDYKYMLRKVEEALAYCDEGLSKDMAVYLLMRDL